MGKITRITYIAILTSLICYYFSWMYLIPVDLSHTSGIERALIRNGLWAKDVTKDKTRKLFTNTNVNYTIYNVQINNNPKKVILIYKFKNAGYRDFYIENQLSLANSPSADINGSFHMYLKDNIVIMYVGHQNVLVDDVISGKYKENIIDVLDKIFGKCLIENNDYNNSLHKYTHK